MITPEKSWEEYRYFVFAAELDEGDEQECKRAFFAGAESVFRLLESLDGIPIHRTIEPLQTYRELNKQAAMETIPPEDKQTMLSNLNRVADRLIDEIERKSALGEIE